jgi:hypothetical protein
MKQILNLFKKKIDTLKVIEEIHHAFYTEVDRLLESAKISNPVNEKIIKKAERLRKLGFIKTKEVEIYIKSKMEEISKNERIELINYFSSKYPLYKLITKESVKSICNKYGLIYGPVNYYKGDVPDVNLRHIENFKISDNDKCFNVESFSSTWFTDYNAFLEQENRKKEYLKLGRINISRHIIEESPLEIVAPVSDFDTTNMKISDFKLSKIKIPDPVVLQPVFYKGEKHYLIVTAWGNEASDSLIVNEKMN